MLLKACGPATVKAQFPLLGGMPFGAVLWQNLAMMDFVARPERIDINQDIERAIPRASRAIKRAQEEKFAGLGLTLTQALLIGHLDMLGGGGWLNQTELARQIGLRKARAGMAVDSLVNRNLMERVADPGDKRAKLVSLTAEGMRLAAEVDRAYGEIAARARQDLTVEQRQALVAALNLVARNLAPTVSVDEADGGVPGLAGRDAFQSQL
jgi:MarR family transcriptional regulator, transcriptional regulator for hemolysin